MSVDRENGTSVSDESLWDKVPSVVAIRALLNLSPRARLGIIRQFCLECGNPKAQQCGCYDEGSDE